MKLLSDKYYNHSILKLMFNGGLEDTSNFNSFGAGLHPSFHFSLLEDAHAMEHL